MLEIYFKNKQDANYVYQQLCSRIHYINEQSFQLSDHKLSVFIDEQVVEENRENLKEVIRSFIFYKKRDEWARTLLASTFYYTDEAEQDQILDVLDAILTGENEEAAAFIKNDGELIVEEAVESVINNGSLSFSFDSFVQFRLRPYIDRLSHWVEVAIDEYKMEQEYQMFIQMLREFLWGREAKISVLHIYNDKGFVFYNEYFEELTRAELVKMIDRKLLSNHPVYIDSVTIAPLLSIAPTSIYVYTDEPEEPLVTTIQNIFEERVTICSKDVFEEQQANVFQN